MGHLSPWSVFHRDATLPGILYIKALEPLDNWLKALDTGEGIAGALRSEAAKTFHAKPCTPVRLAFGSCILT